MTNEDGETLYYHVKEKKLQSEHPLILRYKEVCTLSVPKSIGGRLVSVLLLLLLLFLLLLVSKFGDCKRQDSLS